MQDFLEACGLNRKIISIPVRVSKLNVNIYDMTFFYRKLYFFQFETPIYGLAYPNFTDFATPGVILT